MTRLVPAVYAIRLSAADLESVTVPVLTIHGSRDRSGPPAGGREWARQLSNARFLSVENAGHMPWIEAPEEVFGAIATFLAGRWPDAAESVSREPR